MKISKLLKMAAFIAAVAGAFAFTPPTPGPYGKHPTLGAVLGVIIGPDNCDIQVGAICRCTVGSGFNAVNVDAYADLAGANLQDEAKRLRRPVF